MILPASFVLLVVAILLLLANRRGFSIVVILTMLLVLWMSGTSPVPQRLLSELQQPFLDLPPPEWSDSNAIVVLGSGTVQIGTETNPTATGSGRIDTAVAIWRDCKAAGHDCNIVVSGGDPRGKGVAEADVFAETLQALGVPSDDILRDTKSRNTFENARLSRDLLTERKFDRIFLVTSGYHMRRSLLFFRHFGLSTRPVPAFMLETDPGWLPVAGNMTLADAVLHEILGMLQYRVYNAFGWYPPPIDIGDDGRPLL